MAFVEYQDVRYAAQAMATLQGSLLLSSDRGAIRIEYAKSKMAEVGFTNLWIEVGSILSMIKHATLAAIPSSSRSLSLFGFFTRAYGTTTHGLLHRQMALSSSYSLPPIHPISLPASLSLFSALLRFLFLFFRFSPLVVTPCVLIRLACALSRPGAFVRPLGTYRQAIEMDFCPCGTELRTQRVRFILSRVCVRV